MLMTRDDLIALFKGFGYTIIALCNILGISRPTLKKYFDSYCDDNAESIPAKVLNLLNLATKEGTTAQDIDEYFGSLPLLDFRFPNNPRYLPQSVFKFLSLYDVKNNAWTNKVAISKEVPLYSLNIEEVIRQARISMINYGRQVGFSRFGATGIPTPEDYEIQFPSRIIAELYRQYFDLLFLSSYFRSSSLSHSKLADVNNVRNAIDYALLCIEYVFEHIETPDDDHEVMSIFKEVNRDTFDVTRKKKWFVVPRLLSNIVDGYPNNDGVLYLPVVRAVSVDDAVNASDELFRDGFDDMIHEDSAVFGPFDDEMEAQKVRDFLDLSWQDAFGDYQYNPDIVEAKKWLDDQRSKKVLKYGGL